MLAGGKVAKVDRVEWLAIADPNTAVNALLAGEIDLIEAPPPDLFPMLKADKNVALYGWNALGQPDHHALQPPASAVQQREGAPGGDVRASPRRTCCAPRSAIPRSTRCATRRFICGTRYGKEYGDLLIKPDLDKARALLKESGYDGTPIVMMHQTDLQSSNHCQPVAKQQLEKAGFKVDLQSTGLADRGVAARPQGGAATRAAGTSSSPPTSPLDADNPGHQLLRLAAPATRRGSAGRAMPRWRSCATPSLRETDPEKQKALGARRSPTA